MSTFADLTKEEIISILNTAMDDGEWHTPHTSDISIHTQSSVAVYGYFNCSKHNTYHDQERWFNINGNSVHIWIKEYDRGRADKSLYRPIYNFRQLANILDSFKPTQP
jgi:hypothetical protein